MLGFTDLAYFKTDYALVKLGYLNSFYKNAKKKKKKKKQQQCASWDKAMTF